MEKENKRAVNFTSEEEHLLICLVDNHKKVIENKTSNVSLWKEKENAWAAIEGEFNSQIGRGAFRSRKHLKDKYCNFKKKAKKVFAENKVNICKTGGGSYIPKVKTPSDLILKEMLGVQLTGLQNSYDNDASVIELEEMDVIETVEYSQPSTSTACITEVFNTDSLETSKVVEEKLNWATYTPSNLKQPVSAKLQPLKKRQPTMTRKNCGCQRKLVEEKLDFLRIQKEKFLEEHALRMELLKKKIMLKDFEIENIKKK